MSKNDEQPALDEQPAGAAESSSDAPEVEEAPGGQEEVIEGETVPEDVSDADAYKPPAAELAVIGEEDVYRAMDRADEELILDELQGRALAVMVYSFNQGGQKITDLSYAGVSEAVRTINARGFGKIKVADSPPLISEVREDGIDYYRVMAYAVDEATGAGRWGTAVEPKQMKLKDRTARAKRDAGEQVTDDGRVWDKFALTKALNKAQRNAMRDLIPLEFRQTIIAQYLGDKDKVRHIRAGGDPEPLAELPAPLTDERAEQQREECRAIYKQIQDFDRLKILPREFHANLIRVEHDHDRLDDFIGYLKDRLAEVKEAAEKGDE